MNSADLDRGGRWLVEWPVDLALRAPWRAVRFLGLLLALPVWVVELPVVVVLMLAEMALIAWEMTE